MDKRIFCLTVTGEGGELCIGKVRRDFADFWRYRDQDDLAQHMLAIPDHDSAEFDNDSPPVVDFPINDHYEIDDILHLYSPHPSAIAEVREVKIEDDGLTANTAEEILKIVDDRFDDFWEKSVHACQVELFEITKISERYDSNVDPNSNSVFPVLLYATMSEGVFLKATFITNTSGLDPELLQFSGIGTDVGDFIDKICYDGQPLQLHHGDFRNNGIGFQIGYWQD
jgi:hypothetical protein